MPCTPKLPKIDLRAERITVPLDRLVPDPANVRRDYAADAVAALAGNIAAEGLLQNLGVRPEVNAAGAATGNHLVSIGGRRLAALRLLVSQKRLPKNAPIPCNLRPAGAVTSASAAENMHRVAMHPAEQFAAFARMADEDGLTENEIATRFGVSVLTVQRRLRLGRLSPVVLAALRCDAISEAVAQAFAITDDHDAQERILAQVRDQNFIDPRVVRTKLTEGEVPFFDRRVRLVGLDAYTQAGGLIREDLFNDEPSAMRLLSPDVLDRLVNVKLAARVEQMRAEGWQNVRVTAGEPDELRFFTRVWPRHVPLSAEDEARRDALTVEGEAIHGEAEADELTTEQIARIDAIETELEHLSDKEDAYSPEDMAEATAFVFLAQEGVEIFHGRPRSESCEQASASSVGRAPGRGAQKSEFSAALLSELHAQRTVALQAQVAERPGLALRLLVQRMVMERGHSPWGAVVRISPQPPTLRSACPSIEQAPAFQAVADLHERRGDHQPGDNAAILPWLLGLDDAEVLSILAPLVASTVDAGSEDWSAGKGRLAVQAAHAAQLDVADWWTPTADTYFSRVSKSQIAEAVRETGVGTFSQDGKKADVAAAATRLLADCRWLPKPLRTPAADELPPDRANDDSAVPEQEAAE